MTPVATRQPPSVPSVQSLYPSHTPQGVLTLTDLLRWCSGVC